ncbi:uncharacterized protein LOC122251188 [Penaeus japonicus]|uniref:uncharacterized protein LOC122251188 n=1 Tax=Penaeus japonicus TaxID=27405 RepID=UPI001C70F293|nr:uncharacterized protein LOC122251188 [Penaeus japonicus]
MRMGVLITFVCLAFCAVGVWGHGRLMDPPARNAMWRLGYPNPVNYNDNELYCGGFVVQYQKNDGKCGVCGDNFADKVPRDHEAGGLFGNGIIGRRFVAGQVIDIEAELTTNHKGYMELKLCPHNDPKAIITQACLDEFPLMIEGTKESRWVIPEDSKKTEIFRWKVQLPEGITCTNCVIQWKYFAGNTWGTNTQGETGQGKGPQETFVNCADVTINTQTGGFAGYPPESNQIDNPWALYYRDEFPGIPKIANATTKNGQLIPLVVRSQRCVPVNEFSRVEGMEDWCRENCLKYPPNCHPQVCKCLIQCEAIGDFAKEKDADIFCHQNCLKLDSYCPKDKCRCY